MIEKIEEVASLKYAQECIIINDMIHLAIHIQIYISIKINITTQHKSNSFKIINSETCVGEITYFKDIIQ